MYKIPMPPDDVIWQALRDNHLGYAKAARALATKYGDHINRTNVWKFANNKEENREKLQQLRSELVDEAEAELMGLVFDAADERVRLNAIKYFLDNQGRSRGYNTDAGLQPGDYNVSIKIETAEPEPNDPDLEDADE